MRIKVLLLLFFASCGPAFLDFTVGLGADQNIKKTIDSSQKESDAQVEGRTTVFEDVVEALPLFLRAAPTPTPVPVEGQRVKSVTIELEPKVLPEIPIVVKQPYVSKPVRRRARPTSTPCP